MVKSVAKHSLGCTARQDRPHKGQADLTKARQTSQRPGRPHKDQADLTPSSGITVTAMGMLNSKMFCHCIASLLQVLSCERMMFEGSYEKNFCWQESNLGPHSHEATSTSTKPPDNAKHN